MDVEACTEFVKTGFSETKYLYCENDDKIPFLYNGLLVDGLNSTLGEYTAELTGSELFQLPFTFDKSAVLTTSEIALLPQVT